MGSLYGSLVPVPALGFLFLLFSFMTKQMAKQKETEKTSTGKREESEDE